MNSDQSLKTPKQKCRNRCCRGLGWTLFILMLTVFILLFAACVIRAAARHNLSNIVDLLETRGVNYTASTGVYTLVVTPQEESKFDLHHIECSLLGTIYVRLCNRDMGLMREILCGANVVVSHDHAWYYNTFGSFREAYHRISSHYSLVPQYGVPEGQILKTLLTGQRPDSVAEIRGTGDTWFQFEGAEWNPAHNPSDSFIHMLNYLQYKLTNRNVGPLGSSSHTDKNPIVLPFTAAPMPNPTPIPKPPPSTSPTPKPTPTQRDANADSRRSLTKEPRVVGTLAPVQ